MTDSTDQTIEWMLTTVDNPFDPFTQWDAWFGWDTAAGYNTAVYLSKIVMTSDELSEADQQLAVNMAIDEIVKENVLGLYRKVSRSD